MCDWISETVPNYIFQVFRNTDLNYLINFISRRHKAACTYVFPLIYSCSRYFSGPTPKLIAITELSTILDT